MDKEIAFLVNFQGFVSRLIGDHFDVLTDATYFEEFHRRHSLGYASYLWTNHAPISLTNEQVYLKSLSDLISPILEISAARRKIATARSRTGSFGASSALIGQCKLLALESYRFCELLKVHFDAAAIECVSTDARSSTKLLATKLIRSLKTKHREVFIYRNYLVHSGKNIADPFRDLVYFELAAITLHNDLWLDYNNEFELAKDFWRNKAIELLTDMTTSLNQIELLIKYLVESGQLRFACADSTAH